MGWALLTLGLKGRTIYPPRISALTQSHTPVHNGNTDETMTAAKLNDLKTDLTIINEI